MAMTFTLVERTPYRLRYLATTLGAEDPFDTGVIPNAAGVTPDLRTDAGVWNGQPIDNLVSTPAANQAAARELLLGDTLTTNADIEVPRAHTHIIMRTIGDPGGEPTWAVDANEGAAAGSAPSAGFAVLQVFGPSVADETAYIDIDYQHTFDR